MNESSFAAAACLLVARINDSQQCFKAWRNLFPLDIVSFAEVTRVATTLFIPETSAALLEHIIGLYCAITCLAVQVAQLDNASKFSSGMIRDSLCDCQVLSKPDVQPPFCVVVYMYSLFEYS